MAQDITAAGIDALTRSHPSVVEFARTVTLPDGGGGMYDPGSHPAQLCIYQAADAGASSITIVKPVQDGGSLASFVLILRRIHALAQTGIIAYPTMAAAKDAWTTKVWPILAAQGGTVPQSGGGSRGGASSVVTLPSGGRCILRAAGGRHESGQASATGDCLLDDETDDWPSMRVLRMIERRITKSPDPLIVHVSTVKRDGEGGEGSHILRLYDEGTQTRLHYPCPHCTEFGPYEFAAINYEQRAVACAHCAALITEPQRLASLKKWRRVDGAKSRKFSILWTALDSPFPISVSGTKYSILDGLAEEYEQAARQVAIGDHGLMRQYVRDRFCRPYRADIQTDDQGQTLIPTRNRLAALSAASQIKLDIDRKEQDGDSVHLCHLPAWCEHLTVGVDVQQGGDRAPGRLYFAILGRGGGRGALVGWGTIISAPAGRTPSEAELHASLSRLDGLLRDWSPSVPIVRRGVDVGDRQDEIRRWLKSHPDWWAVKGTGALKAQVGDCAGWLYRRQQDTGWVLHLVETEGATRAVHGEILAGSGVGSLAMPHGLERQSAVILHICATVEYEPGRWSTKPKDRARHPEWQTRHDYLDALAYARALAYGWENTAKKQTPKPMQPTEKDSDYGAAVW
jgi:hypothetical protein